MKVFCIAPIKGLEFEEENFKQHFYKGFYITNNLQNCLFHAGNTDKFKESFGRINFEDTLGKCKAFVYGDEWVFHSSHQTAASIAALVNLFWLIENNNCFISQTFFSYFDGSEYLISHARDLRNIYNSNCFGNYDGMLTLNENKYFKFMHFREDYHICSALHKKYNLHFNNEFTLSSINISSVAKVDYNGFSRLQRAWLFLLNARSESHLPLKITNYVFTIECLFSLFEGDERGDIVRRLKSYLGKKASQPKKFEECYKVRNEFIHGKPLNNSKTDSLISLSSYADDLCRKSINKILIADINIF